MQRRRKGEGKMGNNTRRQTRTSFLAYNFPHPHREKSIARRLLSPAISLRLVLCLSPRYSAGNYFDPRVNRIASDANFFGLFCAGLVQVPIKIKQVTKLDMPGSKSKRRVSEQRDEGYVKNMKYALARRSEGPVGNIGPRVKVEIRVERRALG